MCIYMERKKHWRISLVWFVLRNVKRPIYSDGKRGRVEVSRNVPHLAVGCNAFRVYSLAKIDES